MVLNSYFNGEKCNASSKVFESEMSTCGVNFVIKCIGFDSFVAYVLHH